MNNLIIKFIDGKHHNNLYRLFKISKNNDIAHILYSSGYVMKFRTIGVIKYGFLIEKL